jgi:hypothetical protein
MDQRTAEGTFTLVIAQTSAEMSGIDFRARTHGILLVIEKPFST